MSCVLEPLGDPLVPLSAEQLRQQLPTSVVIGLEELRKLALGQQHDLGELCAVQPQLALDDLGDFILPVAERRPCPITLLLQVRRGLLRRHPLAPLLGALVRRRSSDAVPRSLEREFQRDLGLRVGVREVGVQACCVGVVPRDRAVQREGDGIQHGALAGAGGAFQQEEATLGEKVEVDRLLFGERTDGSQRQAVESHQAALSGCWPASTASWMTAARCSSISVPVTYS